MPKEGLVRNNTPCHGPQVLSKLFLYYVVSDWLSNHFWTPCFPGGPTLLPPMLVWGWMGWVAELALEDTRIHKVRKSSSETTLSTLAVHLPTLCLNMSKSLAWRDKWVSSGLNLCKAATQKRTHVLVEVLHSKVMEPKWEGLRFGLTVRTSYPCQCSFFYITLYE
jgi:hypothetical protein